MILHCPFPGFLIECKSCLDGGSSPVFAYDAADSGDDGASVDVEEEKSFEEG